MNNFKFLRTPHQYGRFIWRRISIDGYSFNIHTDLSATDIMVILREVGNEYQYSRMWDDDMNRQRLLDLLHERFDNATNFLPPKDETINF